MSYRSTHYGMVCKWSTVQQVRKSMAPMTRNKAMISRNKAIISRNKAMIE